MYLMYHLLHVQQFLVWVFPALFPTALILLFSIFQSGMKWILHIYLHVITFGFLHVKRNAIFHSWNEETAAVNLNIIVCIIVIRTCTRKKYYQNNQCQISAITTMPEHTIYMYSTLLAHIYLCLKVFSYRYFSCLGTFCSLFSLF